MTGNTITFHRHGGKDWYGHEECPFCENDRLKDQLAEAVRRLGVRAENLARLQSRIDHLEALLDEYSKALLDEKKSLPGERTA